MRIRTKEFESMQWDEFKALLSGLGPDTALGRVVAIRAEENPDVLKHFTEAERRIRNQWRQKNVKEIEKDAFEQGVFQKRIYQNGGRINGYGSKRRKYTIRLGVKWQ